MSYFFNEAARVEHLEHVAYYEEQRKGLGARYLAAFETAMGKVCESPSGIVSNWLLAFGDFGFQGFRTTFFIACPAKTSRSSWLHLIDGVRAIGSAGSD